jgi:hypothetical protein
MANAKSENPTKTEIAAACRLYDRTMKAAGATWNLKLVLDREGEQTAFGTIARYRNRTEFTPDMRRTVLAAARAITRAERLAAVPETKPTNKAGKRGERKPAKGVGRNAQELFESGRRIIAEIGADDRKTAGESRQRK